MKRYLFSIGLITIAIILFCALPAGKGIDNLIYDQKVGLLSRHIDSDVVLVEIDQESLDFYRTRFNLSFPWPRSLYGRAIKFLSQSGASCIVLDMIFSEPSLYEEEDMALAEAMRAAGNVFLPFFLSGDRNSRPTVERFALSKIGNFKLHEFPGATSPIPPLLEAQKGGGNAMVSPDQDRIFRQVPHLFLSQGRVYPSLALAVVLFLKPGWNPGRVPLAREAALRLLFYRDSSFHRFSIAQIVQSQVRIEEGNRPIVKPADFKGKTIIIGATAPGLFDLHSTPLKRNGPGCEIWATSIQNFLSNTHVREWPLGFQWLLFFSMTVLVTLLQVRMGNIPWFWQITMSIAMLGTVWIVDLALFALFFLDIRFLPLAAAVILPSASEVYYRNHVLRREKKKIQMAFEYYLSDSLLKSILKHPEALRLGGEKRLLTIFFSDLAEFTSISELLSPEKVVDLLNIYLERMTSVIRDHEGYVDKFEGDAIMALWGAPVEIVGSASKAMKAALLCQKELAKLNREFISRGLPNLHMRVGINSGEVIVGNIGSKKKINYTAIGDAVNLASRLEGVNKQYGTSVICGSRTRDLDGGETIVRRLDRVRVKGKSVAEEIFEVVAQKSECSIEKIERIRRFEEALSHYFEGQFCDASRIFASLDGDPAARIFHRRCLSLGEKPPVPWDGVWTYSEK